MGDLPRSHSYPGQRRDWNPHAVFMALPDFCVPDTIRCLKNKISAKDSPINQGFTDAEPQGRSCSARKDLKNLETTEAHR